MRNARDYHRMAKTLSGEAFCAQLSANVFLIEPFGDDQGAGGVQTAMDMERSIGGFTKIAPVVKSDVANAFGYMITIGRTKNNDIAIESNQISKFHAYVVEDDGEAWICDSGSTNGTFLNEEQLVPQERFPLAEGDRVRLGEAIRMRYFTPAGLYAHLASLDFLL